MITKVFGKTISRSFQKHDNIQIIIVDGELEKEYFTAKPTLETIEDTIGWAEICSFEGYPFFNRAVYNSYYNYTDPNRFNISEDEEVKVEEQIFRADLNELHLRTNKIVNTIVKGQAAAQDWLDNELKHFNRTMILSNEKLKQYCDIHELSYENTDCYELFELVYPTSKPEIIDGRFCVKDKNNIFCLNNIMVDSLKEPSLTIKLNQ
jgi:hypothetical protein